MVNHAVNFFLSFNYLLRSIEPNLYNNSISDFIFSVEVPLLLFLHFLCLSKSSVFSKQHNVFLEHGPESK